MTVIFTDGGCAPTNPGPGAWAAFIVSPSGQVLGISGYDPDTTNNRMELLAAINALENLPDGDRDLITIVSDSKYLIEGATSWMSRWKMNGWKTSRKTAVDNRDLWLRLDDLLMQHSVKFEHVYGHTGDKMNEAADQLVAKTIEENR